MTGPLEVSLRDRICAALDAAASRGTLGRTNADIAAAIDAEAGDGRSHIIEPQVRAWRDGSLAPSLRTLLALAKMAGYEESTTKQLVFGGEASGRSLTETDYLDYIESAKHARAAVTP